MDYTEIKEHHERRPFEAFGIRTADGRLYTVDHPAFLMQSRDRLSVVYTAADDRNIRIDADQITALEVANTNAAQHRP